MRQVSLHQSVFRLVIGLVLMTSVTIIANLWWATHQLVEQRMSADVQLAQASVATLIKANTKLLNAATLRLQNSPNNPLTAGEFNAKSLFEALSDESFLSELDLVSTVDAQGHIIASNLENAQRLSVIPPALIQKLLLPHQHDRIEQNSEQASAQKETFKNLVDFVVIRNRLYQISLNLAPESSNDVSSLIGVEIDPDSLQQLVGATPWAISLRAQMHNKELDNSRQNLGQIAHISSESEQIEEGNFVAQVPGISEFDWYELIYLSDRDIGEQVVLMDKQHIRIELELVQSLSRLSSDFRSLKANVSLIIIIAVSISFVIALLYSRRLTKPIRYLANVANNISLGNYHQKLDLMSNSKEFSFLANALDTMQSNIKSREKQIIFQAEHDPLTKLYSRYHAGVVIDARIKAGESFQTVCVNIIGFRDINDVFGYQFGDYCLTVLASRLKLIGGFSAYFGGGNFLWISRKELLMLEIEELKASLEQLIFNEDASCTLKISLAILDCPTYANDSAELFKRLSIALDEAKGAKVPWIFFDPEIENKYTRRLSIVAQLRRNLANGGEDFSLFYQPKLHIKNQKVEAVEALIRWEDPQLGFVSPEEFIQIAEHAGLIGQVTMWVIKSAIQDAKKLAKRGQKVCIAINLSARDLVNNSFLPLIIDDLRRAGLNSSALSFEITESDLVKDTEAAVWHLKEYKRAGFELAIDDFGTGYSSMAYLKTFPVDYLKIDKSFVLDLASNKSDRDIVETTLQLAHRFGLKVIAEGVEDQNSLDILAMGACDYAQGYFISRPVPLRQFIEWNAKALKTASVNEYKEHESESPDSQQGIEQLF